MSWFSNPFKSLQNSDNNDQQPNSTVPTTVDGGGTVKDDLSAISDSISRQLWNVASFLAPPPEAANNNSSSSTSGGGDGGGNGGGSDNTLAGIRSDLAEIGGTFKNSLSIFSSPNKAVSRISELASNFLQFDEESNNNRDYFKDSNVNRKYNDDDYDEDDDEDDEEEYGVGVTDQVIEFARQISERPELWIDFPLSLDHDFDMSDAQSEHTSIVEQLVPNLADLRSRIIQDKSEKQFWMIYFILLLPRLTDDDLELLSTPAIVEAREKLLLMLRSKKNEDNVSESSQTLNSSELNLGGNAAEPDRNHFAGEVTTAENSTALRSSDRNDSDVVDSKQAEAQAAVADNSSTGLPIKVPDDVNRLRQEEPVPSISSPTASKRFQSEDDLSFSDLEDEENDLSSKRSGSGPSKLTRNSSTEGSTGWVRLNNSEGTGDSHQSRVHTSLRDRDSEGEESVDWLTVDDFHS